MGQIPYNSYHGRKRHGRSVLIGVVTALVILLAAVLAGYYLGFFDFSPAPAGASPAPSPAEDPAVSQEPVLVVEAPSAQPSPSPTAPEVDLSVCTPREALPLGLVAADYADVSTQAPDRDVIVDMTGVDLASATALPNSERYIAAWWSADPDAPEAALDGCKTLASLGFDEIVLSSVLPEDDGKALASLYRQLKTGLDEAGWQGRLGLDVDQDIFGDGYDGDLIPAVAQSFQRLYFRRTLSTANKTALTENGFVATGYTIVTVVKSAASLTYAWAVLP